MSFINNKLSLQFNKLNLEFGFKYTFIFLLSLVFNGYLFGLNVALLSSLVTLLYFTIPNKNINLKFSSKIIYIYLIIILSTFSGYLTTTNLYLSLVLNLLVPFIIVCIYSDKSNTNGYMFYYCLFVTMQISDIKLNMFHLHLLSIFSGLIIGFIFEEVIWSKSYKSNKDDMVGLNQHILDALKCSIMKIKNNLDLNSDTFRFGIRLSIATAFSLIFWKWMNLPKWYWISIATCFTLIPVNRESNNKAFQRLYGTVLGAIIFILFSFLLKDKVIFIILTILSALLMLSYIPYKRQVESYVFSTCFALAFSVMSLSIVSSTMYRVTYVILGVLVTIIFNKLVLPNNKNSTNLSIEEI